MGCGADSDLLRDQDSQEQSNIPTGLAYSALQKGIYTYKKIDDIYLGFDYFTLEERCTTQSCAIAHQQYIIFDGNITQRPPSTKIQLSKNGWYEKSQVDECTITFNGQSIQQICPDGRDETISFTKQAIDSKKLTAYDTRTINADDLKDAEASFNNSALQYDLNTTTQKLYEITLNKFSKCYDNADKSNLLVDSNLSTLTTIFCAKDNISFTINDLNLSNGSLMLHNDITKQENQATWQKKKVFNNYELIEINATDLEKPIFVVHYNGHVYAGSVLQELSYSKALNKDGFNAIYTQLADKYSSQSLTKKHLSNNLYKLGWIKDIPVYNKKSFIDATTISNQYNGFFSSLPSANWILATTGFHRESEVCPVNIYFNSYDYTCEDGRSGEGVHIKTQELDEKLIYHYLQQNAEGYKLDNNDTFFSVGAQEIVYRYTSDIDTFIFNPQASLTVGTHPIEDNVNELLNIDFFISARDKKHYLKIIHTAGDTNGTADIYALKNNIELNSSTENNSSYISDNIEKIASSTWNTQNIGTQTILQVVLSNEQKKFFNISTKMVLTTFELSRIKVITGEVFQEANTSYDVSYINFEGFTNIESLLIE